MTNPKIDPTATARNMLRRLRGHIPIEIKTKLPNGQIKRRQLAEHESAHIVVAMATGAAPLLLHIGTSFGGVKLSDNDNDALSMTYGPITSALAVAGMVWDCADWIGAMDAMMLYRCLTHMPQIGPYPNGRPRQVNAEIRRAKIAARRILREHRPAVLAVADALDRRCTLTGKEIVRIGRKASPTLPKADPPFRKIATAWDRALSGDDDAALGTINVVGLGEVLRLARKEMASKEPSDGDQPAKPRAARRR